MNVKLTKQKAWELISRIQPRLNIKQEATPSDVAIFKASTGPEGLEIRCENDWFNHNGRIKLTIGNVDGGTPIIRYYYPDTLNRDYVAEQAEKEAEAKQARKEWVWATGVFPAQMALGYLPVLLQSSSPGSLVSERILLSDFSTSYCSAAYFSPFERDYL